MGKLSVTVITTAAVVLATLVVKPAIADDPGANPAGKWACLLSGDTEVSAQLTMTDATYAFAQTGRAPSTPGTYRIDRNVITLTSGTLRDDFGLTHGRFNTRAAPLVLTFSTSAGRGMTCNPDTRIQ